jgi:uncharacterized protein (TIGR03000 family)
MEKITFRAACSLSFFSGWPLKSYTSGGSVMRSRFAALFAPIALLFGAGIAPAAPHGGGGHAGHAGHAGAYHGGYHGGYYGGDHHHHNGWAVGIGIGFGLGYGYGGYGYGGYGSPYYGGYAYPAYPYYPSYPYYGYAVPVSPAVIADPAGGYYMLPADGTYTAPATNGSYTAPATNGNGNGAYTAAPARLPAGTASEPAPATVNLVVPAGAKVWFDGKEASDTEGKHVFTSPAIEPGKSQTVSVKVEMNGGTSQMRIPLRAGEKMTLDMRR